MRKSKESIPEIIDNVWRVFQAINEYSKTAERSTGLTGPQLWALKILVNYAPIRVSDLARQMYLSAATVVGILDRLEGKGLVTRSRSQDDRRAVDLYLTQQGKELAALAPEIAQIMLIKGLEQLPDKQFYAVEAGMKQLVRMLDAERIIPQPLYGP